MIHQFLKLFSKLLLIPGGREFLTFSISAIPVLELRGGMLTASILKIKPVVAFFLCVLGNMLFIPFILYFITPIFTKLKSLPFLKKRLEKLETRALSKSGRIEQFRFFGLMIFVAIPLPGTGAFTGAFIAALLDMKKRDAFLSIFLGILIAGIIMVFVSYGMIGLFFKL